jgi:hypothetical protein
MRCLRDKDNAIALQRKSSCYTSIIPFRDYRLIVELPHHPGLAIFATNAIYFLSESNKYIF